MKSLFSTENKQHILSKIQQYFETERNEEIGNLAAENLLDFFMKEISPFVYNQAIYDARVLMQQKMLSIEEDFYAIEKPLHQRNKK